MSDVQNTESLKILLCQTMQIIILWYHYYYIIIIDQLQYYIHCYTNFARLCKICLPCRETQPQWYWFSWKGIAFNVDSRGKGGDSRSTMN